MNPVNTELKMSQSILDHLDFDGFFVVIIGKEREILGINPRAIKRLQLDAGNLHAKNWFTDICMPSDHPNFSDAYEILKHPYLPRDSIQISFENALQTPAGEVIQVKWRGKGIYEEKFEGILCIGEDITGQRQSEEILKSNEERYRILADRFRTNEERYRQLLVSTNDFVWEIDDQFKFAHLSQKVEEIMGYSPSELLKRPVFVYAVDLETKNLVNFSGFDTLGQKIHFQGKFFHKSGKKIYLEFRGSVGTQGGKRHYYGVCSDITDNVLIEQHNKEAEHERIRQQKYESLELLAGGIAHDFNNLLSGILGSVNLLQLGFKDAGEEQDLLKELEEGTLRARDLVKQLLTFSKGDTILKKTASISEIIEKTTKFTMRGSLSVCKMNLTPNLPALNVDTGQISQVLNNLLLNATQAMTDGGIIEISTETIQITEKDTQPLTSGEYIKISVKDYGPGIPKELQPRIFEPYFTTKKTGNGIGLATCYKIIKNHSGHITLNPDVKFGTEFFIYLPTTDKPIEPFEDIIEITENLGKFKRLLLLEDDPIIHRFLQRIVPHLQIQMDVALDGESCIQKFRLAQKTGKPYDVLIFDLVIPGGMGGKDAVKIVRKLDENVHIIVSSGYSNDPVLSQYKEYGFNQVLKKPFTITDLKKVLTKSTET